MKVQEGSVLKYLNFRISQSPLGFNVDHTDVTVSYLTVSTDYVLNTTNNETEFPEITIFFKEHF